MDPGPCPGFSLKDVKWSAVAVPLDLLVSTYRLPQLARLDSGVWGAGVGIGIGTGSGHRDGRGGAAGGSGARQPPCCTGDAAGGRQIPLRGRL